MMCLLDIFNFLTLWTLRYINCTLSDIWHKSHLFSVSLIWQEITYTKVLRIKLAFLRSDRSLFHRHTHALNLRQISKQIMKTHLFSSLKKNSRMCIPLLQSSFTWLNQRELNRWSQFSEQKLRFFSKVKI